MLSMTGFGSSTHVFKGRRGSLEITAEIRTVNSKFLDLSVRSPRPYVIFDADISKFIRTQLKRGRVDVNISARVIDGPAKAVHVNHAQAKELWKALNSVREDLGLKTVEMGDLLAVPDWIESKDENIDTKEEWLFLKEVLSAALDAVTAARKSEGESLEKAIRTHLTRFEEIFKKIASGADAMVSDLRKRLRERVLDLHGSDGFDPQRLEQEITLWISRSDFREELDRIRHHLGTFETLLKEEREHGRKLEFLVQELQREVNTLGSKCSDAQTTPQIIELKTCIERIREQLQNSE
ncbi:MAG: YicC-like protein [Bacteriovoracaceae bacterium]|nr:YicC-like protein [Bacteriovoracaceae bacterium]